MKIMKLFIFALGSQIMFLSAMQNDQNFIREYKQLNQAMSLAILLDTHKTLQWVVNYFDPEATLNGYHELERHQTKLLLTEQELFERYKIQRDSMEKQR